MADAVSRNEAGYALSAKLVHITIASIISAILAIGGYMVVWAINDAAWKARLEGRIEALETLTSASLMAMEKRLSVTERTVDKGVLPRAEERLLKHEKRFDDHETRLRHLENHP